MHLSLWHLKKGTQILLSSLLIPHYFNFNNRVLLFWWLFLLLHLTSIDFSLMLLSEHEPAALFHEVMEKERAYPHTGAHANTELAAGTPRTL